jgi:hypothetical protein
LIPIISRCIHGKLEPASGGGINQQPMTFAYLEAAFISRCLGLTLPNDQFRIRFTAHIDSIEPIFLKDDRRVGRVYLESMKGCGQAFDANDRGAFGNFQLCSGVR